MTRLIPKTVVDEIIQHMREADIVKFACQEERSFVLGKGQDILEQIIASGKASLAQICTIPVPNEDTAAFYIALYGVTVRSVLH